MPVVEFEQRGKIAWITINRPERANTLVADSFVLLARAWHEVRTNPDILVAVLTGTGTKDFCCGGDLVEYIPHSATAAAVRARPNEPEFGYRQALLLDQPLPKPIVAAINGRALGGGTELIEATDIRIASATATFGLPEPAVGIVPGAGSLVRLPRQMPYAHAMHLMLTGQRIDAETALRWGLISEVVPGDKLLERADELAQIVSRNAPLALRAIKLAAYETYGLPWRAAHAIESEHASIVKASDDAKEGPAAFAAKRRPSFVGH